MRTTILTVAAVGLTMLGVNAACGIPPSRQPRPSTAATATPTPTIDRRVQLAAFVTAAGLNVTDIGGKPAKSEESTLSLAMPCDAPNTAQQVAAHRWLYAQAKPDLVSHTVFAYDPQQATVVIDQLRTALAACTTWTWAGTWTMTVVGEFQVSRPAGVDNAISFCHQGTIVAGTAKGDKAFLCDGYASRGQLVTGVSTVQLTLALAQAELGKALPLAAAALVTTVPTA